MATRKQQPATAMAKPPISIDELQPISLDELTPVDDGVLDVRGGITARRLNPPPEAFGDPNGDRKADATAAATGMSAITPAIGITNALLTGDWSIPKAQLTGGVRAIKNLASMVVPSPAPRYSKALQSARLPAWMADTLASNPIDPFAMSDKALGMIEGVGDQASAMAAPGRAVYDENRPPTREENEGALAAESELATSIAAPLAIGPATLPMRRYLGVTKPSRMMNSLLSRGDPRAIAESLERGMDRQTYSRIDPREAGVSNVGLTNLDEIGAVGDARKGAFETKRSLDDIHAQTQDVLQNQFGNVQIPMQEATAAIVDPIVRRLRNVQDGVAPGSVNVLTEFLQKHTARFQRTTGGRTDPVTINAYKRDLYDLLNDADFKKAVGDDPSLQGIMREQASGLRELVDRYTADPATGISPVAELNRTYGDMRPALDAWEGLIIRKETQGARSGGTITPSSLNPAQAAQVPVRRGLFGALGEAWDAPWRVTTTADMLRRLAPDVPRPVRLPQAPPPIPPQGLLGPAPVVPPAPQAGPALPAANVQPQRALPPATGATPQFTAQPPVFPAPPVSPLRLPPAPIEMLPDDAGVWQRGALNVGESGGLDMLPMRGEQTITPTPVGVTPRAPVAAPSPPSPSSLPSPTETVFGAAPPTPTSAPALAPTPALAPARLPKLTPVSSSPSAKLQQRLGITRDEAAHMLDTDGLLPQGSESVRRLQREGYLDKLEQPTAKLEAEFAAAATQDATQSTVQSAPRAAAPTPTISNKPRLWEMTSNQLDDLLESTRAADSKVEVSLFGEEGAKRYARLQRRANSSMASIDDSNNAYRQVTEMEDALTESQRNRLFGVADDTYVGPDEIRAFRRGLDDLDDSSPSALGSSLRWAVTKIENVPIEQMPLDGQVAAAQMRRAYELSIQHGWNPNDVLNQALREGAKRFDPSDVEFMLQRFKRDQTTSSAPIPTRRLPAGVAPLPATVDASITPSAALDTNRNAIAPKRLPKPETPEARAADVDYASMSAAELDTRLEMAVRARDTAKRTGAGTKALRALDQRIADIHAAIAKPMQPDAPAAPVKLAPVAKLKTKARRELEDLQNRIDEADRQMKRPRPAPSIAEQEARAASKAAEAAAIKKWVESDPLNQVTPESVLSGRHPWPKTADEARKIGFSDEELGTRYQSKPAQIPDDAVVQLPDGTRAEIDRVIEVGVGEGMRTTYVVKGKKYTADQLKVIPKRISAMRNGQYIDGVRTRTFQTRNGKALILRADDGSERMVFESEVRA